MGYWFRKKIIQIAKLIPFLLVTVVLVSYIENESSLYYGIYISSNGNMYLDQEISFIIGNYIRYDVLTVIILYALSFGLNLCWRNKLCVHYLTFNLIQRWFLENIEVNEIAWHMVFLLNIILCTAIITINIIGYIKWNRFITR